MTTIAPGPGQATNATCRRGRIGHEQIFVAKTRLHTLYIAGAMKLPTSDYSHSPHPDDAKPPQAAFAAIRLPRTCVSLSSAPACWFRRSNSPFR